ncbi:HD domain-containing protein [Plectosphaerella cucumerina]|uniref:HD domain-containing protein n=1 Tax=Plectosphaerella cucumerina TaxID=40658 RepID=A0A8K0TJG6_9PEZI|nr:HD domain-containing protein [Plectosphaerella cucumerina]
MALIHDLPEAVCGDIPPNDMGHDDKIKREQLGMDYISCLLRSNGMGSTAEEWTTLWIEYELRETLVANIVHQIDKLEALQQAAVYSRRYPKLDLTDFKNHRDLLHEPWLCDQADIVLQQWPSEVPMKSELDIVFVVGGPGVGKGTQCALAGPEFLHLSVGELLRNEQNNPESGFRDFISDSFQNSVVVPPQLSMLLIRRELEQAKDLGKSSVLLDGFPRSFESKRAKQL